VGYNQDFGIKGKTSALKEAKKGKTEDSFTVGDKVMTKSELLKLGYTEAQIQQAVKLGTIKTK
jgi:Holliday junction resolvasome RuvABC DNA-binding subunit